ncbi:MAG TPA: hypothetical protein VIN10_04905 [Bacteroidales bacterium]
MSSNSETGHPKNVANYASLVQICLSLGESYNPSNAAIKVPALQALLADGQQAITRVNVTYQPYALAVAARQDAFKPVSKLVSRIYSALVSSGAPDSVIEIALTSIRKLQGRRANAKLTEEEKLAIEAETGKPVVEHSSSQQSMDSAVNFFEQLLTLLQSVPEYAPNEPELQVTALQAVLTNLKTKNEAVMPLESPLTQARAQRDQVLYTPVTGLIASATKVKAYLKSLLGTTSPIYKQATALKFSNLKKK